MRMACLRVEDGDIGFVGFEAGLPGNGAVR
jgi:hypothetical protein